MNLMLGIAFLITIYFLSRSLESGNKKNNNN
jgi:hypothetical protein